MMKDFSSYAISELLSSQHDLTSCLAHDKKQDRTVIIKELPSLITDQTIVKTFLTKVNVNALLNQKLIVESYQIESFESKSYLVREYLDLPSLETSLLTTTHEIPSLVKMFLGIARSLQELHKQGFHHLNLKPSNIFLLPENQFCFTDPYPIDNSTVLRQSDFICQSIYTAPEVLNSEDITESADIYSLGLIFLQFLSTIGKGPASYPSLPEKHIELEQYIKQISSTLPNELRLMIEMMVNSSKSGRLKSTKVLISTLSMIQTSLSSNHAEEKTEGKTLQTQSRQYLAIAILVVLIIIFWIIVTS